MGRIDGFEPFVRLDFGLQFGENNIQLLVILPNSFQSLPNLRAVTADNRPVNLNLSSS